MDTCRYRDCTNEIRQHSGRGRPSKYCSKSHANMASRARKRLCRGCRAELTDNNGAQFCWPCSWSNNWQTALLHAARKRAKEFGRECTITVDDIVIPSRCPILGIELKSRAGPTAGNSATIDRIDNNQGYVPGNVHVISMRANTMKRDKTIKQLSAGRAGPEWRSWARKRLGRPERRVVTGKR